MRAQIQKEAEGAMSTPLHQLGDHGQSVWIDFLSRQLLRDGELARMMREDAISGVTLEPDHLPEGDLRRRCLR